MVFYKRCGCGRTYDLVEWLELQESAGGRWEDPDEVLELRDCPCGSSIAVLIITGDDGRERRIGDEGLR